MSTYPSQQIREMPAWREERTGDWLDALGRYLLDVPSR
jgi:hypothetical protein